MPGVAPIYPIYRGCPGLEVTMRDALSMRRIESLGNLRPELDHVGQWQRAFERRALDVFHHEIVLADVEQRADMRMIQAGNGLGFALEALAEASLDGLDGDGPVEPRVTRPIDRTHPAHADGRFNAIGSEDGSWREFHVDLVYLRHGGNG